MMEKERGAESRTALCASVEPRFAPQWGKPHSASYLPLTTCHLPLTSKGFTLVEMIMVIVITGIIGGIVAVFLKAPIQQYTDVARRADMTDIADTALRRIGRDLRLALPNSVRVAGTCNGTAACFIEFLPTKGGGRYRAGMGGDELDFSSSTDDTFEVLATAGQGVDVISGDSIVVYNLGIAGADAYEGSSRRAAKAAFGSNLTEVFFDPAGIPFPFDSPGRRFHVISAPVAYACDGAGTLWRYWGYAIKPLQADTDTIAELDALIAVQGARARLATHVSSCRFSYDAFVVAQRSGLVTTNLGITEEGETVTLYSAVHVSNQP